MLILWKVSHMAGILYGALTDDGYGVGTPFKSSRIGKDIGYKAFKVLRDVLLDTVREEDDTYLVIVLNGTEGECGSNLSSQIALHHFGYTSNIFKC